MQLKTLRVPSDIYKIYPRYYWKNKVQNSHTAICNKKENIHISKYIDINILTYIFAYVLVYARNDCGRIQTSENTGCLCGEWGA